MISTGLPFVAVPNLAGMYKAEATTALSARHFRYAVGTSQYSSTIPPARSSPGWTGEGKTLLYGSTVTFAISLGHAPVKVPNVKGTARRKAIATLEADGLTFSAAYGPNNVPVFTTDPVAGTVVPYKTGVAIYLGQQNGLTTAAACRRRRWSAGREPPATSARRPGSRPGTTRTRSAGSPSARSAASRWWSGRLTASSLPRGARLRCSEPRTGR